MSFFLGGKYKGVQNCDTASCIEREDLACKTIQNFRKQTTQSINQPQSLYLEDYILCRPMPQEIINLVLEKRRDRSERRANLWLSYCFLFFLMIITVVAVMVDIATAAKV
jgi:hypothetical protein